MLSENPNESLRLEKIEIAKDWTGPEDPGNPQNWTLLKKTYHMLIPTSIAFLCPFGSSVYTPGANEVATAFGVSKEVALLPFCLYLLGLSFGPVFAAPMSETFGRKYVYMIGLPIFGLFTLGSGFSQDIVSLTVCRAFPMAAFVTSVQLGPALGPTIGGFVVQRMSWRWTQWVILFALVPTTTIMLFMSETYKKVVLKKRAKKLNIKGPVEADSSVYETIKLFIRKTVFRPLHMLCTETIVFLFSLYIAINFGLLNAFFAAFPLVFKEVYGFELSSIGLTFLGQAVGSTCGFGIIVAFDKKFYQPRARALKQNNERAKLPPEQRLWIAMAGAPMLPISLFWFGWTARQSMHWISPVAAEALFSCGNILIFTCSSLYLTDSYGAMYGASAWSTSTFLRYFFAAVFPLFADQMFETLGTNWACSLLGFLTLVLVPIPFAFYVWGPRLRKNSKYSPEQ